MMTEEERGLLKAASFLLGYPDAGRLGSLDSLKGILEALPGSRAAKGLVEAVSRLSCKPLLQLQEEYTRLFDFSPPTCLNLTYHKWGDGKERGQAMARLKRAYQGTGLTLTGGELPDYLPLVLEYLSVCPDDSFIPMIKEYQDVLRGLACRLDGAGSVYALCLGAVLEVLAEPRLDADRQPLCSDGPDNEGVEDSRRTES